jgi:hypothetical protein
MSPYGPLADPSAPQRNVRYWHKADIEAFPINVRFRG